jgi:predicted rRNA methylase
MRKFRAAGNIWKEKDPYSIHVPTGEWIYGVQPVSAALKSKKRTFYNMFIKNEIKPSFEPLVLEYMNITGREPTLAKPDFFGNILQDNNHQGIVLDASIITPGLIDFLSEKHIDKNRQRNIWVVLHEIQDPHNLGAILRNCVFFGVAGVVLSSRHSTHLSNTVAKISSGAIEFQSIYEVGNTLRFLKKSKENGWNIVGTHCGTSATTQLNKLDSSKPMLVVFGNEGAGLPDSIINECNDVISIPSSELVETNISSLNVSVTTGIILNSLAAHERE